MFYNLEEMFNSNVNATLKYTIVCQSHYPSNSYFGQSIKSFLHFFYIFKYISWHNQVRFLEDLQEIPVKQECDNRTQVLGYHLS